MHDQEAIERCVKALLAVTQGMRLCEEQTAAKFGISAAQLAIVAALGRSERCSVGQLADELHLDQSSASAHAKTLLDRQLIRRVASSDARRVEFTLATRGRSMMGKIGSTGRPVLEAALANVPGRTLRAVVPDLQRIASAMLEQRDRLVDSEMAKA